jgi:hypothetical protein
MGLGWDRWSVRRAILASVGLTACGPSVDSPNAEGSDGGSAEEGSGETTASTTVDPATTATTASTTVDPMTSAESSDETGEVPWTCGAPIPPQAVPPPCANPTPLLQLDAQGVEVPTGFELCDDGRTHRYDVIACELPEGAVGDCDPELASGSCVTDADCTDAPNGFCNLEEGKGLTCGCQYACRTDADCGDDQLCLCAGAESRCVDAGCHTDAECGGYTCQLGYDPRVCSDARRYFACGSPADECHAFSDTCDSNACEACSWSADDCAWACRYDEDLCSDCGRPYLVDGRARIADAVVRDDWTTGVGATDEYLDAAAQRTVAAHWLRNALAEHASVAAFARYALDLLALAAPPALVADATRAMGDEIEHAKLCFALAARHGARAHGPGELASDGALGNRSALQILDDVVREACIGETLAALDAIEALAYARDPEVRRVLARIADDELRHAQLGWRHLQWQLGRADARERAVIRAIVERAIVDAGMTPIVGAATRELRGVGVLDTETRARARIMGLTEVVMPCAAAILATISDAAVAVA